MAPKVLRRQLRFLNKASKRIRQEARRLHDGFVLDMLPTNGMLESAMANALAHNKDGRTMLDFTRHLLSSNLLSLASPVGPWDPYDVKPQVFALDTFIALPVFTSVGYLQHFCSSFNFTVRDPSGNLWASPVLPKLEWPKGSSEANRAHSGSDDASSAGSANADSLHNLMSEETLAGDEVKPKTSSERTKTSGSKKKMVKRKFSATGKRYSESRSSHHETNNEDQSQKKTAAAASEFWNRVSMVPTFNVKKATPLPCFGPFMRPYFVGYFGDIETLLSSTSIVPEKVDVVLNPQSPLELVLARDMTDRVLLRRPLMHLCYQQVERELKGEFHRFFARNCEELVRAYSVCMPEQVSDLTPKNEIPYRIIMALESRDFQLTWQKVRAAKHSGLLMGHVSLTIIPFAESTGTAKSMLSVFYDRSSSAKLGTRCSPLETHRSLGVFTPVGPVATVSLLHDANNFYHDPSNAYTESHSVYADMLKYSPPDLERK